MKINVRAKIHPTEDPIKLEEALKNIFPEIDISKVDDYLKGKSNDPKSLEHLKNKLGLQAIRSSARKVLYSGVKGDYINFKINRQAATVNKVSFTGEETPLGPIEIKIKSKNTDLVIDYLAPQIRD